MRTMHTYYPPGQLSDLTFTFLISKIELIFFQLLKGNLQSIL